MEQIKATEEDLEAIETALDFVWRRELDFIFEDRKKLHDVLIITLDSKSVFVWKFDKNRYQRHVFPLRESGPEVSHHWWACGPFVKGIQRLVPEEWLSETGTSVFISGGLMSQFIASQKMRADSLNPYVTAESYMATIVHEFGHAYYRNTIIDRFNDQSVNLSIINDALKAYSENNFSVKDAEISLPANPIVNEIFAFCTDRSAGEMFWPDYCKAVNAASLKILEGIYAEELKRDCYWEHSPLERPHIAALSIGPVIMKKYGSNWPRYLLGLTA